MDVIAVPLLKLLINIADLYTWVVIIAVILSWLVQFNVINSSNRFVSIVIDFIYRATEPVLNKIGGLDLSPIVLILALVFIMNVLNRVHDRFV